MFEQVNAMEAISAFEQPQIAKHGGLDTLSIPEIMSKYEIPGLSLAVIHDFDIHWVKSYGVADRKTGRVVLPSTVFQAGSVSKPVSALGLLKAVSRRQVSLDEDINERLSRWKLNTEGYASPVTARMLASHTSGLGDFFGFPGYDPRAALPTLIQILNGEFPANGPAVRMERPPLQAMTYSGGGSTILQLLLEEVTNKSFDEYLQGEVLDPLSMNHSTFKRPLSSVLEGDAAHAHGISGEAVEPNWKIYPESYAAGLWSNPTDLALFAIEVQKTAQGNSTIGLSRSLIQEMLNPVGVGDFSVGFRIERRGEGWYFYHAGRTWGYSSFLMAHKLKGYGFVMMINRTHADVVFDEIRSRLERLYHWDSLDRVRIG
jgi:CubicO group peptidase (beta-lactamase class C family)